MNELALFAGAGGGLLGSRLLGWRTVCAVEIDPWCRETLLRRQKDGYLDPFPIWDDVRTFDARLWTGHIDVISGGFPCQDISAAGTRRGIAGPRSGLVFDMLGIIDRIRPAYVFAENSPQLRTRGLATIIERLSVMGYMGRVGVLGAGDIGANHLRKRMWILAYSPGKQMGTGGQSRTYRGLDDTSPKITDWWEVYRFEGMDDGMANRMDRIRSTGNGQIPGVAALAWRLLSAGL